MVGHRVHASPEDVESEWRAWAVNLGFRRRTGLVSHDLTYTDMKSRVYISGGMWVADCPKDGCNGAAACWVEHDKACCLDCGTVFKPAWPTAKEVGGSLEEAVAVLAGRAHPRWRNFRTPSNPAETVSDLKAQNVAMGDALPGGKPAKGPHPLDPSVMRA